MREAPAPMVLDATPAALERPERNSTRWKEASIPLPGFGQHQDTISQLCTLTPVSKQLNQRAPARRGAAPHFFCTDGKCEWRTSPVVVAAATHSSWRDLAVEMYSASHATQMFSPHFLIVVDQVDVEQVVHDDHSPLNVVGLNAGLCLIFALFNSTSQRTCS